MELSRRRVITKDKRRKASWEYEETALVYRVGKRGSTRYYRVYETDTGLKFEFEFKPSKSLQKLFLHNYIQQFEHKLTIFLISLVLCRFGTESGLRNQIIIF